MRSRSMLMRCMLKGSLRVFLIAVGLIVANGSACAGTSKHFLWRIKSATNTVYLLGSIHAMQPSDYPLAPLIEKAFEKSANLVLEFDLTKIDPTKAQKMIFAKGLFKNGKTLHDALPEKTYRQATHMAKDLGLKLTRFNTMTPWLASIVILQTELKNAGFAAEDGIDMHFANQAKQSHEPIIGLETAKYQMSLLAGLPQAVQQRLLLQSLQQAGELKREMGHIVQTWSHGNANQLATIMHKEFQGYPTVYQRLIVTRNHHWVPKIEKLIGHRQNYFIVVGALHLVGADGLIAQLRKAGYSVDQL